MATFVLQLLLSGPLLRRFGVAVTIVILPLTLGAGTALILLLPAFWPVLLTNACDQGFRFSVDKSTYELLYLPLAPNQRGPIKAAIDIVVSRVADAAGAVLLGVATHGFFMLHGMGLGLRGTAAVNLVTIGAWFAVAWRLRVEVRAHDSAEHPPPSHRRGAGVLGAARSVRSRGACLDARERRSRSRQGCPVGARSRRG